MPATPSSSSSPARVLHPKQLFARIPRELIDHVALVGDEATVRRRIAEYEAVGVAEIGLVPPAPELPSSLSTLGALAS